VRSYAEMGLATLTSFQFAKVLKIEHKNILAVRTLS
jgi:hypothetical protein